MMKKNRVLSLLLLFVLGIVPFTIYADGPVMPQQETTLHDLLQERKISLIVIRHGEAMHNLRHLMSSTRSPGVYLTDKGIHQVRTAAEKLNQYKIDRIYVSPVYRTLQTAQILAMGVKVPAHQITIDARLREQFFGEYEERTFKEYGEYFSTVDEMYLEAAPGGESGREVFQRTRDFLVSLAANHYNETILVVTHGFNCCQISMCLSGAYDEVPGQAEFKVYSK